MNEGNLILKTFDTANSNQLSYVIQRSDELNFVKIEPTAAYSLDFFDIGDKANVDHDLSYIMSDFDWDELKKLDQTNLFDDENSNLSLPPSSLDDGYASCLSTSASSSPQSFSSECDNWEIIQNKCEPSFIFGQDETYKKLKNAARNKKKPEIMKDCLHIWQFLRDLLKDKQRNGRVIEWLSPERGIFKIINASIVANLWSMLKSNKVGMKYANMARGIRYSREEGGYFDLVSKKEGFGKKLVYKFSQKAKLNCEWLSSVMV